MIQGPKGESVRTLAWLSNNNIVTAGDDGDLTTHDLANNSTTSVPASHERVVPPLQSTLPPSAAYADPPSRTHVFSHREGGGFPLAPTQRACTLTWEPHHRRLLLDHSAAMLANQ